MVKQGAATIPAVTANLIEVKIESISQEPFDSKDICLELGPPQGCDSRHITALRLVRPGLFLAIRTAH